MNTSEGNITSVDGALVCVIAVNGDSGTFTIGANIPRGTRRSIVAGQCRVGVDTSCVMFTRVVGTRVVVVTILDRSALTYAVCAHIVGCTEAAVGAGQGIVGVNTTLAGVTTVGCARVVVVATIGFGFADAAATLVAFGAGVSIVARTGVVGVGASCVVFTAVIGTRIVVVAIRSGARGTFAVFAKIALCTETAVGTGSCVVGIHASFCWVAKFVCARIVVLAVYRCAGALPACTCIS